MLHLKLTLALHQSHFHVNHTGLTKASEKDWHHSTSIKYKVEHDKQYLPYI